MSINRNPRVPTQENLEYFYQQVLLPKYSDDKTDSIDIGDGQTFDIPELTYETKVLKPDSTFERGDLKWKPRQMFLNQNKAEAFREWGDKFKPSNVEQRREAVKSIPSLEFSMQEVKLIKPIY